jgi:membrane protease subunit (stomatin/prohibitin family)
MENGNKKILWLIAIVNILTLILLTGFIVMSWDVITTEKTSQQENQQQVSTQQQTPQAQQQAPPTGGQIQPPAGGATGKCGDGVCGPAEKANPSLCPKDCK